MNWKVHTAARRLTPELLKKAVPDCKDPATWAPLLDDALAHVGITEPSEIAMFLAQTGHESLGFNRLVENFNYSVKGLLDTFSRHRISEADAARLGRTASQRANQEEIANIVYGGEWGRRNLGNIDKGDGWAYRGRGLIHTTGLSNYIRTEQWIDKHFNRKINLVWVPSLLKEPNVAVEAAVCYWLERVRPKTGLREVTIAINGGTIGYEDRKRRLEVAQKALGVGKT